ncbi:MAG: hypothetical protein IME93_06860 [Proteobacteria bacterium]|nr:hypothetical protein [Pseudomonadota bacterium]
MPVPMRRHNSFLTLLLVLIFTAGLPLTADARNGDRHTKGEKQQRTKSPTYGSGPVRPAPRERVDRRQTQRADPRTTRQTRRTKPRPVPRTVHDRYYRKNWKTHRQHYRYYPTYYYHTYYLAPILYFYYPIGYSLAIMPGGYVSIFVGGLPYYYYGGVYYRHLDGAYVVVRAPIGAIVYDLPVGFIAFNLGVFTYFYVNEAYYLWDEDYQGYVVVKKPKGADRAIAKETKDRLYVYPKKGQSEDKQAKDRYACHRWAVKETGVDPTEGDTSLSRQNDSNYKRAITACLEGRGYTVK